MNPNKKQRLEANGWKVGNTEEFLGLTDDEKKIVDNSSKLLRWSRTSEDSPLFLEVFENNKWVNYKNSLFKQPDYIMPGIETSKGFATAQKYLSLGYKYIPYSSN